jgi:nicotinate-nucleotide pyrophosphorylase (carboxylating)
VTTIGRNTLARATALEVSGGVDLAGIRDIARTGVDRINSGKLSKDVQAVDLCLLHRHPARNP